MDITNFTSFEQIEQLVNQMSSLTTVFQAIGGLILAYIVFNIINTYINRKKRNELRRMRQLLERIDKNISKLSKKK